MSETASKNDQKKADLSLLNLVFLEEVARAMMVGEKKYGRYNYCKGHNTTQLIAAISRHLYAYNNGEEFDPIDGQSHLGSIGACVNMLLRQRELGTLKDGRYVDESKKVDPRSDKIDGSPVDPSFPKLGSRIRVLRYRPNMAPIEAGEKGNIESIGSDYINVRMDNDGCVWRLDLEGHGVTWEVIC